jgi:aconitate hydratase
MAPGSKVVTEYLEMMGLTPHLEALGFHLVGYGCTTCIGNSGPLHEGIVRTIEEHKLVTAAVISGNRNYEARINPWVRANYLASPILVVAYAIAGTVEIDLTTEPLCMDPNGVPVYLKELWPGEGEIRDLITDVISPDIFEEEYVSVFDGSRQGSELPVPEGKVYEWDPDSTYIREPPFFVDLPEEAANLADIEGARVLGLFGDTITTDHISPAGNIPEDGAAGQHLLGKGVEPPDFNSFGSRRGNHEVMMRGTFANIRIRNTMVDEEGGYTIHHPSGDTLSIFDASQRYLEDAVPLVVLGGWEYGAGSSRDWAAKGAALLGVKAIIARSYERIHRSNLVGMGVLPLRFLDGESAGSLGLDGSEELAITGIARGLSPGGTLEVTARGAGGEETAFQVMVELESDVELEYYRNGGILQKVLRDLKLLANS